MGTNNKVVTFAAKDKAENVPAYQVKLERVLGLTVPCNAALDCDPEAELVAYPAGCTVVLCCPRKGRQQHLLNSSRKTITCLRFGGGGGRYLATGECGHLPLVRVWDLQEGGSGGGGGVQVAEFQGHTFGIVCVAFSPNGKYIVSVGTQHDMIVNVWDWRAGGKVASNKVSARVKAVDFAENGSYFVTVGNRHVKFWYLEYTRSAKFKEAVPLMGRSAILGEQRNNYFCDVACGRGDCGDSTFVITKSGLLCEFNNRRLLDKWVELRTTSANCMVVGGDYVFIGCAEGIVRCFSPSSLQFVTTLPRTHYLGVDVALGLTISHMASHPATARYPDAIALTYDATHHKLTVVYNDHSLYVWDVHDIKRVGKSQSYLYHSACIWGVDNYPAVDKSRGPSLMPPGSFVTCSSDDTIRVWNLDPGMTATSPESPFQRNIYSNDLLKVLYVDKDLVHLKDQDLSSGGGDQKGDGSCDGRNGVRSVRISPDGRHLASGDRSGNIRVHDLRNLKELFSIEAHDAEVLCLEYSRHETGHKLLASASRDRLIHVFNVDQEYNFMQTLDDHSSSITAVRFLNTQDQLQLVSCSADKSLIFRQLQSTPGGSPQFSRGQNVSGKTTLYDMEVDSGQKHVMTAGQDRNIRVYNVSTRKPSKTFRASVAEEGSMIKLALDSSGMYAATSCTDKTLCIYDYYSGELMATMYGQSDLVTGLRFSEDCRRLVSASGDGCLFVWQMPHDMVVTMHARLAQQAARMGRRPPAHVTNGLHPLDNDRFASPPPDLLSSSDNNANPTAESYRFDVGPLPPWAKKQQASANGAADGGRVGQPPAGVDMPRGRWAQRIGPTAGITVKSVYDEDTIIPYPQQDKRMDSDGGGSKDSSIDSGTETLRQYPDIRRDATSLLGKQVGGGKVTVSRGGDISRGRNHGYKSYDEHDGDDESYSDENVMYYPAADETGSDFTVNAMDVEELRRSQRRNKKARPQHLIDVPHITLSTSVSGSQDSDEDDEDTSTPSADTAERNLLSMLSVSTESLERFGQREKYFTSAFESLSAAEQADRDGKETGGTSISAQFQRSYHTPELRNMAVINAARQTRAEGDVGGKREELRQRIENTRRQLNSVNYRSTLKNSQSICDLSRSDRLSARRNTTAAAHPAHRYTPAGADSEDEMDDQVDDSAGLRRACSLSDLVNPTPRRNPVYVSGKAGKPATSRYGGKLAAQHNNNNNMTRSTSMVILTQAPSDSESELSLGSRSRGQGGGGLMRPTISSQNKVNSLGGGGKGAAAGGGRRRGGMAQAYSSVNLSTAGRADDSSSEDGANKPSARPRSASTDRSGTAALVASAAPQPRPRMAMVRALAPARPLATAAAAPTSPPPLAGGGGKEGGLDVASAPLNAQLCASVARQLTRTADSVVQLCKRLAQEGDHNAADTMLGSLREAVAEAQRTLRLVHSAADKDKQPAADHAAATEQQPPPPAAADQAAVEAMMLQYSEMLMTMVQQKMSGAQPN